jgi:hypothetical protein
VALYETEFVRAAAAWENPRFATLSWLASAACLTSGPVNQEQQRRQRGLHIRKRLAGTAAPEQGWLVGGACPPTTSAWQPTFLSRLSKWMRSSSDNTHDLLQVGCMVVEDPFNEEPALCAQIDQTDPTIRSMPASFVSHDLNGLPLQNENGA